MTQHNAALMDSPDKLAAALRKSVRGEVFADPFSRTLYSTDASIYEIEPLAVVYPLDEQDVRACLRFGHQHALPVIARGGGTGLTGESLGKAIILDLAAHMNWIIELDKARRQVTVQPGVTLGSLNRGLARHGFRLPVDPASGARCTLGGMIANNASGAHSLKFGDTRQNLIAARLCLCDGTSTLAMPVKFSSQEYEHLTQESGLAGQIHRALPELLRQHAALIEAKKLKSERNRSGYNLAGVVGDDIYDLPKLICGSEGTLAVVTQAILKVEPLPEHVALVAVYFSSLLDAARAIPAIRQTGPAACELLNERLMRLSREVAPKLARLLPESAQAMLIVEYEGHDDAEITARFAELQAAVPPGNCQSMTLVTDPSERAQLWASREAATPYLYRRRDGLQPVPIVEDGAVPIDQLAAYIEKAGAIFDKYKLEWSGYAHAGHGEVHLRPLMDLHKKEHLDILEPLAAEVHAAVWECGGTISGEHGEGLARAQFIEQQAGSELYAVFKQVKALFDPTGRLNPDKKISADPHLLLKNLRFGIDYQFAHAASSPLNWAGGELAGETERCNGCATCRTTGPEKDMCPRFKCERVEAASPRAKANVLRRLMTGRQRDGSFANAELIEIMNTCFNCKLCASDCPAGVNIPKLVLESKARHHQIYPLPLDKWVFTQTETLARLGLWVLPLANSLAQAPLTRWLLEKTIGIDRRRALPLLKKWKLRRRYVASEHSGRPTVVLYPDLYARYYEPEIAQAAIDVLEHNGFAVEVPDAPWCNMPALTHGALAESRRNIARVSAVLAPFAFKGLPIVTVDPSACLALREDFLYYLDTPETRAVSRHTVEIGEFLRELQDHNRLKTDFRRLDLVLGYHQSCHHKALKIGQPGMQLVRQIPGVTMHVLTEGCCGIAGAWGVLEKNYDESVWIGADLFHALKSKRRQITWGLTECPTCKMQLEHGTGKKTVHPVQVLAQAYGYQPAQPREDGLDKLDLPQKAEAHGTAAVQVKPTTAPLHQDARAHAAEHTQ